MRVGLVAGIAAAALVAAAQAHVHVKKEVANIPSFWVRDRPAQSSQKLELRFALKQSGTQQLERKLLELSDPDSPTYGKWLSKVQAESYLSPTEASRKKVKRWLEEHGIDERRDKRSHAGSWIAAQVTVERAREMFQTDFSVFKHRDSGEEIVRSTEYSIPKHLDEHIDLVSPMILFSTRAENKARALDRAEAKGRLGKRIQGVDSSVPKECDADKVSMTCLRKYYGTFNYIVKNKDKQLIGISGFMNHTPNMIDMKQSTRGLRPDVADLKLDIVQINGGVNNQSEHKPEPNMDVQMALGMAYPIPLTYYSTGGNAPTTHGPHAKIEAVKSPNEGFASELEYLLQLDDAELPSVLSTSYSDDEWTVPIAYQRRVCYEAAALGARGVSIFTSADDDGVGRNGTCFSDNDVHRAMFVPKFPSTCPFVTTVGATQNFAPERAAGPEFYSGGGFSIFWPMPEYQKAAVEPYIKSLGDKYKGMYNPNGRAFPDVSAQGSSISVLTDKHWKLEGGSSASTPIMAGIFALLNDQRISGGKSKLGFINPRLYKYGFKGFKDITIGSNKGCGTDGFPAQRGWDAATGWGTPIFAKLSQVFA